MCAGRVNNCLKMINELKFISDPISMHIWASLHNYAYQEAVFAAERLFAETKSEEGLFMLATCYYRMGRPKQTIRLLSAHDFASSKVKYLLARCLFDCNMLNEAENTLLGQKRPLKYINDIASDFADQACYALLLLGDIYRLQQKYGNAAFCYRGCLQLNPVMWSAYEHLCSIGEFIDPDEAFKLNANIGLLTPTLSVVGQSFLPVKSPVNAHVKAERDRLGSRENVNPNSPPKEAPIAVSDVEDKLLTAVNTTEIIKSTYLAHFATLKPELSTTQAILPDDLVSNFTPIGFCAPPATPNAPIVIHDDRRPKRKPTGDNSSQPGVASTPSFGVLSMVTQSPMFACVPVNVF